MKKFDVRVETVTHFYIDAETAEQAEAIVAKMYDVSFNDDGMYVWDSSDEYNVTEITDGE